MKLLSPKWNNYKLMDCGNFEKLEKFGDFILSRPEPQAVWDKNLSEDDWKKLTNAAFKKEKNNPEKGQWELGNGMPERWY
ncbi:MAG: oxidoreductase, partial [Bacteroidota bacterium]|nr:oxidoreductase [Bacteroidota bacterium]